MAGWRQHQIRDRMAETQRHTGSSPARPDIWRPKKLCLQVHEHPGCLETCLCGTGLKFKLTGLSSL